MIFCTGCAPDYVNNKPSGKADLIATSHIDTQMKITTACNTVVTKSSSLLNKVIPYLEKTAKITIDDKNSIIEDANNLIATIKKQREYMQSFNPAKDLNSQVLQVVKALDSYEADVRALKTSVENNDYNAMTENMNRVTNQNDTLKNLSIV